MSELKIIGNGHERDLIYWRELSPEDQEEFDYASEDSCFFRYKGDLYCLDDFADTHNHFWAAGNPYEALGMDGYNQDTFFSAVCIKLADDNEHVKVYIVMA